MKYKVFIFGVIIINLLVLSSSCTSCSRSGRAKIISMAQKEASKKSTKPEPNTIIKDIVPDPVVIDDVVSPKEKIVIEEELIKSKIPKAEGVLIQVEGLIAKEVSELTIDLKIGSSQINQILAMKNYVFNHWHYIFDPDSGHDTWRSAEATLSLKYKGKYPGDCDDFAILMASFARQIGLRSRMVGGYDGDAGHAFAEFLVPENEQNNMNLRDVDSRYDFEGRWISLDWFTGRDHKRYLKNSKIYEDI
jgi:transglutaminase-like putative cysteine protease